jgi:hypothetical protein
VGGRGVALMEIAKVTLPRTTTPSGRCFNRLTYPLSSRRVDHIEGSKSGGLGRTCSRRRTRYQDLRRGGRRGRTPHTSIAYREWTERPASVPAYRARKLRLQRYRDVTVTWSLRFNRNNLRSSRLLAPLLVSLYCRPEAQWSFVTQELPWRIKLRRSHSRLLLDGVWVMMRPRQIGVIYGRNQKSKWLDTGARNE